MQGFVDEAVGLVPEADGSVRGIASRIEGREHDDVDMGDVTELPASAWKQISGPGDRDRHDRRPGLHRELKGAVVKRPELAGSAAGSLREEEDRVA